MNLAPQHPITKALLPIICGACKYQDYPDFRYTEQTGGKMLKLTVMPNMADYPIICGKQGNLVKAANLLMTQAGIMAGINAEYHLEESYVGRRENHVPEAGKFDMRKFEQMFNALLPLLFKRGPTWSVRHEIDKTVVTVNIDRSSPMDETIIEALADLFRPYYFRNGIKLKITAR